VEQLCHLPGVVGFVDGSHVRLSSALGGDKDFYNRKGFPSIQLQVHKQGANEIQVLETTLFANKRFFSMIGDLARDLFFLNAVSQKMMVSYQRDLSKLV